MVRNQVLPKPIRIGERLRLSDLDALELLLKSKMAEVAA